MRWWRDAPRNGNDGFVIAKLNALLVAIAGSAILQPRLQGFAAVDAVQRQAEASFLIVTFVDHSSRLRPDPPSQQIA